MKIEQHGTFVHGLSAAQSIENYTHHRGSYLLLDFTRRYGGHAGVLITKEI